MTSPNAAPVTHPDRHPALGADVTSDRTAAPVTHPDRRLTLGRA